VAWFGIRVNTFANSRAAFAALRGKPWPCYDIPLKAGMSIGMALISVELLIMLIILLFLPSELAGKCFIGFAIGESLGAAALRIAGGIFTKIADIGSDLMKIVFKIKEDDARNPGVIADCVGDNAGDSVGPSADGFETYGVTGVALISFIMLAISTAPPMTAADGHFARPGALPRLPPRPVNNHRRRRARPRPPMAAGRGRQGRRAAGRAPSRSSSWSGSS
jgi:Na+/H+-translocating membrane pyrophosphatase